MPTKYTIPKIASNQDLINPWFIYFRFNGKLVQKKYGINYIKDYEERMLEAQEIQKQLYQKLKDGWNPFVTDIYNYDSKYNIIEALNFAFNNKKPNISERTIKDYQITLNFFIIAANKLNLENLPILELKRIHVRAIFDQIKLTRKWTNKAYNKNLGYIKAIFSELITENIIEDNPSHQIKSLKVSKIEANIVATDDEIILIKQKLISHFPSFFVFCQCIFDTGIRPKELLNIRIKMIDLQKNQIFLFSGITKNKNSRIVPINKFLKVYFENMNLQNYPENYFVFGSNREFTNRGLKKDLDFVPGIKNINRDCASKLWHKLIKTELGINVNLYSLKHLGANKKILAGIELDALRDLYGHSSSLTTLTYAKIVKEINRNQILEKSPEF